MRDIQKILAQYESERGRYANLINVRFDTSRFDWNYIEAKKICSRILNRMIRHSRTAVEECLGASIVQEAAGRGFVIWDRRLPKKEPQTQGWIDAVPEGVPILLLEGSRKLPSESRDFFVLDFFIAIAGDPLSSPTVVECDSLAWHFGRAKYQDELKNKFVASKGWVMLRFMAKRIFTETTECAREVVDHVFGKRL